MKKLTTLFILLFVGSVLFADPKFPKYYITDDDYTSYLYVSNDLQSIYEIKAIVYPTSKKGIFSFIKRSLVLPTSIFITIEFSTEKKLDEFIKTIDLADVENSFNRTRQNLIRDGITPKITKYDPDEKPKVITEPEPKTIYGYGYEEHYDWKTLPSVIGYSASY